MPRTGFEPAHPFERCHLKTVRLPISPPGLKFYIHFITAGKYSNSKLITLRPIVFFYLGLFILKPPVLKPILTPLLSLFTITLFAQIQPADTLLLGEVIIKAYELDARIKETPAAVHRFSANQLQKISHTSILPALNAVPGIRMEERSPGSYRLNIRGSSLRSPFGVRNVKMYYNNVPYTEPGGISYMNQLSLQQFKNIDIIKGPGSSLYGAGTGGVMLISSFPRSMENYIEAGYVQGSYGYRSVYADAQVGKDSLQHHLLFQHQRSDGYRNHSSMERNTATYDMRVVKNRNTLSAFLMAGKLYYQTPGALTLTGFDNDPRQARPGTAFAPSPVENDAAIHQQTVLTGMHNVYKINNNWQHEVSIYGSIVQLVNPTIRNYEQSIIPHAGGRMLFRYQKDFTQSKLTWHTGVEYQKSFSNVKVFLNDSGKKGSLQSSDEIHNQQHFLFTQLNWQVQNWIISGSISLNSTNTTIENDLGNPPFSSSYQYKNIAAPRLAILRKLGDQFSVFASVARGFSPPATAEVFPSGGVINADLDPESGVNYELGFRASSKDNRFFGEANFFYFQMKNTIVQRRDAAGGDYFINAGSTRQKGIELMGVYQLLNSPSTFFHSIDFTGAYTGYFFKYKEFTQVDNNFSGNDMPGAAPHTIVLQADIQMNNGFYLNLNSFYSDRIYLNDANSARADHYILLNAKTGYKKQFSEKWMIDLFLAADNLLDKKYSLGNDINGFGGRYYNAAAKRNYHAGLIIRRS